jgi:hypothetical protein
MNAKPFPPPITLPSASKTTVDSQLRSRTARSSFCSSPSIDPTQTGSYGSGTTRTWATAGRRGAAGAVSRTWITTSSRSIGGTPGNEMSLPCAYCDLASMSEIVVEEEPIRRSSGMTKLTRTVTSCASRVAEWFSRMTP